LLLADDRSVPRAAEGNRLPYSQLVKLTDNEGSDHMLNDNSNREAL
jgi:hypothetical protein